MSALQCENIELKVENRLLKEQLAQAQQSTQYLLHVQAQANQIDKNDFRVHQLEADNAHLAHRLARLEHGDGFSGLLPAIEFTDHTIRRRLTQHHGTHRSPQEFVNNVKYGRHDQDDLLSFDDFEPSPTDSFNTTDSPPNSSFQTQPDTPQTPLTPEAQSFSRQDRPVLKSTTQPIGLGIFNVDDYPYSTLHASSDALEHTAVPASPTITDLDSQVGHVTTDDEGWQAIVAPPPPPREFIFNKEFAEYEHAKLRRMASFIEDYSDAQKESYWDLCGKDGRHSPQEWEVYYEEMVRPAFLRNMAGKQDDGSSVMLHKENGVLGSVRGAEAANVQDPLVEAVATPVVGEGIYASRWAPKPVLIEGQDQTLPSGANYSTNDADTIVPFVAVYTPATSFEADEGNALSTPKEDLQNQAQHTESNVEVLGMEKQTEGQLEPVRPQTLESEKTPPQRLSPAAPSFTPAVTPRTTSEDDRSPRPSRTHLAPRAPRTDSRRGRGGRLFPVSTPPLFFNYHSKDVALLNTILITNIPTSTTLADVMAKVRGGKVVSAKLLPTAGMKTSPPKTTNGAMITFFGYGRAASFVQHCETHDILLPAAPGADLVRAKVELVQTPTRPLYPNLVFQIQQKGLTRVLFVLDSERKWTAEDVVLELLRGSPEIRRPIVADRDEDGILFFEFADVREAAEAWNVVAWEVAYFGQASKGFWPDPCEGPLVQAGSSAVEELGARDTVTNGVEEKKDLVVEESSAAAQPFLVLGEIGEEAKDGVDYSGSE